MSKNFLRVKTLPPSNGKSISFSKQKSGKSVNTGFPFFGVLGNASKMKKIAKISAIISVFAIMNFFATDTHATTLTVDEKIFAEQRNVMPPRLRRPFIPPINIGRRDNVKPAKIWPSRVPVRPTPRYLPSKPKPSHDNRGRFVPHSPRR